MGTPMRKVGVIDKTVSIIGSCAFCMLFLLYFIILFRMFINMMYEDFLKLIRNNRDREHEH
jgi:hypothetical protein